jgi:hypothetical protein
MAAEGLRELGGAARFLTGGIEGWLAAGFPTARLRADLKVPGSSRWITRERPKIDRLACPWLIRRFIDPEAQFFYTVPNQVRTDAKALDAEPYDIVDVTFSHRGPRCSFVRSSRVRLKDRVLDGGYHRARGGYRATRAVAKAPACSRSRSACR